MNLSLEIARLDLGRVSEKEKKIKKKENIISVIYFFAYWIYILRKSQDMNYNFVVFTIFIGEVSFHGSVRIQSAAPIKEKIYNYNLILILMRL